MKGILKKILVIAVIVNPISSIVSNANPSLESYTDAEDSISNLTDEQFEAYEDSIISSLYGPLEIIRYGEGLSSSDSYQHNSDLDKSLSDNPGISAPVEIDLTKEVGEINILSGSSITGAKTYEIPIDVYPGMNGFQPHLSFAYDSQQGDSNIGRGWNISGLSSIVRTNKNYYYDKQCSGIRMDENDSFTLNGLRLIKTLSRNEYDEFQSETGNIVAKVYKAGNIIRFFNVFYPDGTKGTFGYASNTQNHIEYPLTELSDLYGNKIIYEYSYSGHTYNISKISYNGASVDFEYGLRDYSNTPFVTYSGGYKIEHPYIIENVKIKLGDIILGTYELNYDINNTTLLLSGIGYTCGDKSYNPLCFHYDGNNEEASYSTSTTHLFEGYKIEKSNAVRIIRGRLDSNSYADAMMAFPNYNPYYKSFRHGTWIRDRINYFNNIYTGDEKIFVYKGLPDDLQSPNSSLITGKGFIDIICADIEGRQEDALIKINNYVEDNKDHLVITVYKNTQYAGLGKSYERIYDFSTCHKDEAGNRSIQPKFYYAGDFNGDGKMEIMAVSANDPFGDSNYPSVCYIFDLESDKIIYSGNAFSYNVDFIGTNQTDFQAAANNSDKLLVMDYDGDGKADICHIDTSGINIYTLEDSDLGYRFRKSATDTKIRKETLEYRDILGGEFNGDGLMDLLVSPVASTKSDDNVWSIYFSRGDGSFDMRGTSCCIHTAEEGHSYLVHDVNGDGKSDLICSTQDGFSTFLSDGRVLAKVNTVNYNSSYAVLAPANINGHSSFSQLACLNGAFITKYAFSRNDYIGNMMTGMINSMGIIEENEYRFINQNENTDEFYMKGFSAVFPFVDLAEPIAVISSTRQYVNNQTVNNQKFSYVGAVYHYQGLGFRGFEKISVCDFRGRIFSRIYDPYNYTILKEEKGPDFETIFDYDVLTSYPTKITKINVKTKTEKELLRGFSAVTTFKYDTYGLPTEVCTNYSDNVTIKETFSYINNTTVAEGYNLGYAIDHIRTTSRNGASHTEREYIPAHSNRNPTICISYINGKKVSQTQFTYDKYGNVLSEAKTPYSSSSPIKVSYTYDDFGRVLSKIDHKGLTEGYTYDEYGRLSSRLDYRKGVTRYSYDAFGRQTKTIYPDGTDKHIFYKWSSQSEAGRYSIAIVQTGKPTSTLYYDALNREVRSAEIGFDGKVALRDKIYDSYGNLWRVSEPYNDSSPLLWEEILYDSYSRKVQTREACGRITSYSYSKNSVIIDNGKERTIRTYDSQGNLISVTGTAGSLSYAIRPDGQISSVLSNGNTVTLMAFDDYGRQVKLVDPSLGEINYHYDERGNIFRVIDGDGEITEYVYDEYDRVKRRWNKEFNTNYIYDEYDEITLEYSSNSTRKSFLYDEYGRVTEELEYAPDGIWLKKNYTYEDGNIASIKYTSKFGVLTTEYYKYSYGHLKQVSTPEYGVIYDLVKDNVRSQPTEIQTGGVKRKYEYSYFGLPVRRTVQSSTRMVSDWVYAFDNKYRNLAQRLDNLRSRAEGFEYDALNRLVKFNGISVGYDINGNILSKGDVGSFEYTVPGKPYAVSGVNVSVEEIPVSTQNITYTSFARPSRIVEGSDTISFVYNGSFDRVRMAQKSGSTKIMSLHYVGGCYELNTQTYPIKRAEERLYLLGGYYKAPAVIRKFVGYIVSVNDQVDDANESGEFTDYDITSDVGADHVSISEVNSNEKDIFFILRDYLGSITHILSYNGNVVQELSYDAWGRLRDPETLKVYLPGEEPTLILGRGFCGHEHITRMGLINMNARLYDPVLGRFLSPDPNVQCPDWVQNMNRYTYAMNNPLSYIDEDGEFFWFIVGAAAVVGGVANVATHWNEIRSTGGWSGFWKGAGYFAIGATAGGIGAAVGVGVAVGFGSMLTVTAASFASASSGILSGAYIGAASGATESFILHTSNSLFDGKSFRNSLSDGVEHAINDGVIGGVIGGIMGGYEASVKGDNIWSGRPRPIVNEATGNYTCYFGIDDKGNVRYVGITSQEPWERFNQHLTSKTNRADLDYVIKDMYLTKTQARVWEQNMINKYGLIKNGGQLFNLRNEISPYKWFKYGVDF